MNPPIKMCPRCGVEPSVSHQRVYCGFCQQRYQRVRAAYWRIGKRVRLQQIHRPHCYWRTSPALDALYLESEDQAA